VATVIKAGDPRRMRGETKKKVPPIAPERLLPMLSKVQWIDLRRMEGTQQFLVTLPSDDSFLLTIDGFLWVLGRLEFSNPDSVADYAWNFKETTLDLETGIVQCTYERNRRIGRP
jgi:hypothetical protein